MIRISRHTYLALLLLSLLMLFSSVAIASRGRTATSDSVGPVETLIRPDGSSTTTSYDVAGRIAGIVHSKGDSELAHESCDYDLDGNRITQKESNGAVTGNVEQTTTYSYDTADRLTDVQAPDRSAHYVLDMVGNRSSEQITDTQNHPIGNSTLSYDARDELTQRDDSVSGLHITLAYDFDGNTLSQTDASGTRGFGYDANDRLLTLSQPGQLPLTFDYQSDGQRIAKHQGNTETRYQYDQNSLLAETNAIGNTLTRYHYSATQLISRSDAGSTPTYRHYLLDALKTPVALLTQDGAISSRTSYDAWGEIIAQQGTGGAVTTPNRDGTNAELPNTDQQDVGYTGYLKDSESGLYYAKARYYDPRTARFTTQDPEDGKAMQPPSLHRYLYAYANPTTFVDRNGRRVVMDLPCGDSGGVCGQQDISVLPYVNPENIADARQRAALVEAQARIRLTNMAPDEMAAEAPLVQAGLAHVDQPYIMNAKAQAEAQMQSDASLNQEFGFAPDYAPMGTGTEIAGDMVFNSLPPVAAVNGARTVANANDGWDVAAGVAQIGLAVLPAAAGLRAEGRLASETTGLPALSIAKPFPQDVVIEPVRPIGAADASVVVESLPSSVATDTAQFKFDARSNRYRDFTTGRYAAARDLPWPGNRGFSSSQSDFLQPGTIIDRFGNPSGRYAGQPGATVSQRGMAQGTENMTYHQYEVLKVLPAQVGPAAPVAAFGAEGGALQYLFDSAVGDLVDQGFLRQQ